MLGNTLAAPELLRNKGMRFQAWRKWDKTVETLPRNGQKQHEPNNSWLQNKQIEKGLNDRKDLLGIERVERCSQLAAAEWLPQESRARVTKRSGQEWTSFGWEENLELYLTPEEALLLLELNCLELTWKGLALSIQQAYGVLLGSDRQECNIDEYRVYSHLVRQGYRLQRFRYQEGVAPYDRSIRPRRSSTMRRKKLIHDPLDGFGMNRGRIQAAVSGKLIKHHSTIKTGIPYDLQRGRKAAANLNSDSVMFGTAEEKFNESETTTHHGEVTASGSKMIVTIGSGADWSVDRTVNAPEYHSRVNEHSPSVENEVRITVRESDVGVRPVTESKTRPSNNMGGAKKLPSELYDNGVMNLPGPSNVESKKIKKSTGKDSKLQIISDETLLGDFRIITKWPGTRIQRNVKWMPKRNTDGTLPSIMGKVKDSSGEIENAIIKGANLLGTTKMRIVEVPGCSETAADSDNSKGQKRGKTHEIIEVSDDEIEELPPKMSRMEMLDLFPNVISERFVAKQIPRRYLPRNIWPLRISNKFIKWKASNADKRENSGFYEISYVSSGVEHNDASPRWIKGVANSTNKDERVHDNISGNQISLPGLGLRSGDDTGGEVPYGNTISRFSSMPVADSGRISLSYRNEIRRRDSCFCKDLLDSRTTFQRNCDQAARWAVQSHGSLKLGMYTNVAFAQSVWGKSQFSRRGPLHRQNLWTSMSYCHLEQNHINCMPQSVCDRVRCRTSVVDSSNMTRQILSTDQRRTRDATTYWRNNNRPNSRPETGESSFKTVPGAASWAETKAKWLEEKTITIEDEDCLNDKNTVVDESEVKVVAQPVKPLIGRQNTTSFDQAYKNLRIIKPATSEHSRHSRKAKQTDHYRISYNLYSTGPHYKKANPGSPMYRITVFRSEDTPFIEMADIVRLQKDAIETPIVLACVSQTSVTYAELGTVRILNNQDNSVGR